MSNERHTKREAQRQLLSFGEIGLSVLLAFVPWGQGMLDQFPCWAWLIWSVSLVVGLHWLWHVLPRWHVSIKVIPVIVGVLLFCNYGYRSLEWRTRLPIVFLRPGVALNGGSQWTLHTIVRTNRTLYNVRTWIDDAVTAKAILNEPDITKRTRMIEGSHVHKEYPEADSASNLGYVVWAPMDQNRQEYDFRAVYRVGDEIHTLTEVLQIWGDATKTWTQDKWRYAVRLQADDGDVLMNCKDAGFPHSAGEEQLPPCSPKFPESQHNLLLRCF